MCTSPTAPTLGALYDPSVCWACQFVPPEDRSPEMAEMCSACPPAPGGTGGGTGGGAGGDCVGLPPGLPGLPAPPTGVPGTITAEVCHEREQAAFERGRDVERREAIVQTIMTATITAVVGGVIAIAVDRA